MDDVIRSQVELYKESGQWRMTLYAPDWVISDLMRTMEAQTHPQVLVHASACYTNGEWQYIHFTTWGGGAIGSPPPWKKPKRIDLSDIT